METLDVERPQHPHHHPDLPGTCSRGRAADRDSRQGVLGIGHLPPGDAHRPARRNYSPPYRPDHGDRGHARPDRRQAPDERRLHFPDRARHGAGLDGVRDHRSRVCGDRPEDGGPRT